MEGASLLIDIIKDQVTPVLGCSESVAVAYAVATAKEALGGEVDNVEVVVDLKIYKNSFGVLIPGTDTKGLPMAVALAITGGKSRYKLEVLKDITEADLAAAMELLNRGSIEVTADKDVRGFFIEAVVSGPGGNVRVIIKDKHDNITLIEKVFQKPKKIAENGPFLKDHIKAFSIAELVTFADKVNLEDLDIVLSGIDMNKKIAQAGLEHRPGIGLGHMLHHDESDFGQYAKSLTAAGCDARMAGYPLPVMSCFGSGNHGLTAFLPIVAVGEKRQCHEDRIVRAITLSLLVTIYIKSYTGTLSPVCGCGVAAGIGASAGITYVLGGDVEQIKIAINNMIGGLPGMLCDGAKSGCSFKLSIAVGAAVEAALMAMDGVAIPPSDGIVDEAVEQSIVNLGIVSTNGMENTDEVMLDVMMAKAHSRAHLSS